jgi:hypothetical protein
MQIYIILLLFTFSLLILNRLYVVNFVKLNLVFKKLKNTSNCKEIYIDEQNKKIYKKYLYKNTIKEIKYYKEKILPNFDFIPKMEFDIDNNIIIEDYYKTPLNKKTKPNNYMEQLRNIDKQLKKYNIYHNDYKYIHFFVDNNNIKLIDWNNITIGKPKNDKWVQNDIKHIIKYII